MDHGFIRMSRKNVCDLEQFNNRFAASAAVLNETGNFMQRTAFEARPGRACLKAFR